MKISESPENQRLQNTEMIKEFSYLLKYDPTEKAVKTVNIDLPRMKQENPDNGINQVGRLFLRMHASYQVTFGKAWGQGARLIDNPEEIISIGQYLDLSESAQEKHSLFYPPVDFMYRLEKELLPSKGRAHLTIATDINERVVGAAWGISSDMPTILERIGHANYADTPSHVNTWSNVAPAIEKSVKDVIPSTLHDRIFYWDEVFVIPALYKSGLSMTIMGSMLKSIFEEIPPGNKEGQALFFRTSEQTSMGSIAQALVQIGILKKLEVENDDPGILYFAGVIHPALIAAARAVNPERVFRVALRLSKLLGTKQ